MVALMRALGLRSTVPPELLGELFLTFVSGLAIESGNPNDVRGRFDVFCLAALGLGG